MKSYFVFLFTTLGILSGIRCFDAYAKTEGPAYAVSGKNLAALKSMPIKVYLPSKIPADFVLFDFTLEDESKKADAGNPNYSVMFLKDKAHWFQVESSDSIGDLVTEWKSTEAKSDLFGKFSVQWTSETSPSEVIKTSHVISTWLRAIEPNKTSGATKSGRFYRLIGRGLSAEEAVSIVKNLSLQN